MKMKSNNMFRDQVNSVTSWFENWNECEQTVALYSLLKRVSATQCRFLAQVLEQTDCSEINNIENEANDPAFINKLCNESKESAISKLLAHLPLLRAGNSQAKAEYLRLIPNILSYSIENGAHIEESRQLLSYSLIHPAITSDERSQFTMWIGHLEERFTYSIYHQSGGQQTKTKDDSSTPSSFSHQIEKPLPINHHKPVGSGRINGWHVNDPLISSNVEQTNNGHILLKNQLIVPPTVSLSNENCSNSTESQSTSSLSCNTNGHLPLHATLSAPPYTVVPSQPQGGNNNLHTPLRRTHSAVPPVSLSVNDWLTQCSSEDQLTRCRSHSVTSEHAPLSPQSSITSSGSSSDTHPEDGPQPVKNTFLEEGSGMRDVPMWLKSLRLHKYAYIFQQLTYDGMMNISEEWLEAQNVTKGARHKIALSVTKLKERQGLLRSLEKDIMDGGSLKIALSEMRNMLSSPLKSFTPGNEVTGQSVLSPPPSPSEGDNSCIAEGDIPAQFTRLMGKVCTQLLVTSRPDDECFNSYLQLIDKCINHEAFSQRQKKLLSSWKQETQRIWQPPSHKFNLDRKKTNCSTFPLGASLSGVLGAKPTARFQKPGPQWSFGAKRSIVGRSLTGHVPLQRNSSINNPAIFSRPGLFEQPTKQPVTRTQSAPLKSAAQLGLTMSGCDQSPTDNAENYAQLDSLCLSVTEHALGSLDLNEKGSTF